MFIIPNTNVELNTQNDIDDVVADCIQAYIEESIEHFLSKRPVSIEENARYLYSKAELKTFTKQFLEQGGNIETLHIGIVYDDDDNYKFLCYEICHKKFYNLESNYLRKKYGKTKIFWS